MKEIETTKLDKKRKSKNLELLEKRSLEQKSKIRIQGEDVVVTLEKVRSVSDKLLNLLKYIVYRCINKNKSPEKRKKAYIMSIHKEIKNNIINLLTLYRIILVTSTIGRLYIELLTDIIEEEYWHQEEKKQCGFRAGRSCNDLFKASD